MHLRSNSIHTRTQDLWEPIAILTYPETSEELMHKLDEFKSHVTPFLCLGQAEREHDALVRFSHWLSTDGLRVYQEAFEQETKIPLGSRPKDKLIEQSYEDGLNDYRHKSDRENYYSANASIFQIVSTYVAQVVHDRDSAEMVPHAQRHYAILAKLMLDAYSLLADWAENKEAVPGAYNFHSSRRHHFSSISHAAWQVAFSSSPIFSVSDNEIEAATGVMRIAIEARIRYGFGLLGLRRREGGSFEPLMLKRVLEVVKRHAGELEISVPIDHIIRLYGWCNIYTHSASRPYSWLPIFALDYLNQLLRGKAGSNGHDVDAGIKASRETIVRIQSAVRDDVEAQNPGAFELKVIAPEECAVVLRD